MKWFRDVVLIPVIIALVFVFYGAWYTGVKLHAPFSSEWLRTILDARVPLWVALVLVLLGVILPRLKSTKTLPPRVDGFWHTRNCYWFKDPLENDVIVRILEGMFTLRDSDDTIAIIRAYFKGGRPVESMPEALYLERDCPEKFTFSIATTPMLESDVASTVTLILVDSKGREYEMPPVMVRRASDDEVFQLLSRRL